MCLLPLHGADWDEGAEEAKVERDVHRRDRWASWQSLDPGYTGWHLHIAIQKYPLRSSRHLPITGGYVPDPDLFLSILHQVQQEDRSSAHCIRGGFATLNSDRKCPKCHTTLRRVNPIRRSQSPKFDCQFNDDRPNPRKSIAARWFMAIGIVERVVHTKTLVSHVDLDGNWTDKSRISIWAFSVTSKDYVSDR